MTSGTSQRRVADTEAVVEIASQWRRARERFAAPHRRIARDYEFLFKFAHYDGKKLRELEETGSPLVRTADLYDLSRYNAAQISGAKFYLDVKTGPNHDEQTAPILAEILRTVLMGEMQSVRKGYPAIRRAVARMGAATGAGAFVWDIVPNGSRLGTEIFGRVVDPTKLTWDPDYPHFNDPMNGWLDEEVRLDVDVVKARYGLSDAEIGADDGEAPIAERTAEPKIAEDKERKKVTLLKRWTMRAEASGKPQALEPHQRFMACAACGYSEEPLAKQPGYDGSGLPAQTECPACASQGTPSMMQRTDHGETQAQADFDAGKRFRVVAPFYPQAGILEDVALPKVIQGFPAMLFVPDPYPLEPYGNSDAFVHRDTQCGIEAILRMTLEQMQRNRDLTIVKEGALFDTNHEPYQFDGSGDYFAFHEGSDPIQNDLFHFQGSGMNAAVPAALSLFEARFEKARGTGQIQLTPEQIKGSTAAGIARVQETGDVPVDEKIAIFREAETLAALRLAELLVAYWSPEHWRRVLGQQAGDLAMELLVDPEELTVDLVVTAEPGIDPAVETKIKALDSIVAGTPAEGSMAVLEIKARAANMPEEWLNKLLAEAQQRMAAQQQQAMAQMQAAGAGAIPGGKDVPAGGAPNGIPRAASPRRMR